MFQKGDYVIYGNNGACIVDDIGPLDIPGVPEERVYYTLVPFYTRDSRLFVPADHTGAVLRALVSKEEILRLLEEIPSIEPLFVQDEKQREARYKETIRTCDCRELIRVMRTIEQRKKSRLAIGKKMTASDEKYFRIAQDNLCGEFAISLGIDRRQADAFIMEKLELDPDQAETV